MQFFYFQVLLEVKIPVFSEVSKVNGYFSTIQVGFATGSELKFYLFI